MYILSSLSKDIFFFVLFKYEGLVGFQSSGKEQTEIIQIPQTEHLRRIGQGEARHGKYKTLKLGAGQAYDGASD
jgi:hypothetical protein